MDITDKLKAYYANKLEKTERMEVEQLLAEKPHYREVINGIILEQKNQVVKQSPLNWWYTTAATILLFSLISIWHLKQEKELHLLMPEENGLPVFMNTSQKYDEVMNALAKNDFNLALSNLKEKTVNDTTLYFTGFCYINLKENEIALSYFNQVSGGYYKEKSMLWIAILFIEEHKWIEAKSAIAYPLSYPELEEKRNLILAHISSNE